MDHYGVILKNVRIKKKLKIRDAAKLIGKSVGWLCEVENQRGKAKIQKKEFDRILAILDGNQFHTQFGLWIMNSKKKENTKSIILDGAIFKHLRHKAGFSLPQVASKLDLSTGFICNIESGRNKLKPEVKSKLIKLYGYSPNSLKNFWKRRFQRVPNFPVYRGPGSRALIRL